MTHEVIYSPLLFGLFESRAPVEYDREYKGYFQDFISPRLKTAAEKLAWLRHFQEVLIDPYEVLGDTLDEITLYQIGILQHERDHSLSVNKPGKFILSRSFDPNKPDIMSWVPEGATSREIIRGALAPDKPSQHDLRVVAYHRRKIARSRK